MELTAAEVAQKLGGTVEGDPSIRLNSLAKIEEGTPGSLTFLANPKYEDFLYTTKASAVVVNTDFTPASRIDLTLIRVSNAFEAFVALMAQFKFQERKSGIEPQSFIHPTAQIGQNVYVGAFAYIGAHAVIGDNTQIFPQTFIGDEVHIGHNCNLFAGVRIYQGCRLGSHVTIHAGTVIGADGFGFAPQELNGYAKVPQIGNVIIEDNVEIGANTTIDRATLGSTIIRRGVKLDNLIQIAHNVEVGEHTVIAAQAGVAGSAKIGKYCMIGGQVGIVGHLSIADQTKIAAQSGIGSTVKKCGQTLQGSPAFEISDYKRSYVHFRNLPEIEARLRALERRNK
ncbi:MAG: UDP-3-O-(3-hydroxymyristoyl)glucosamine N-acyltransferase [Flavobacteriales bacterium]